MSQNARILEAYQTGMAAVTPRNPKAEYRALKGLIETLWASPIRRSEYLQDAIHGSPRREELMVRLEKDKDNACTDAKPSHPMTMDLCQDRIIGAIDMAVTAPFKYGALKAIVMNLYKSQRARQKAMRRMVHMSISSKLLGAKFRSDPDLALK
ncbi:MAG: hypothetical protein OEX12_00020 [Gammaproteobacteria bacterium]|nr:hypothetical protein [Gammaproteobacteria bacterium]